ncbi:hypothetical protein P5V15_014787 [Pogonomyrmex californicus]
MRQLPETSLYQKRYEHEGINRSEQRTIWDSWCLRVPTLRYDERQVVSRFNPGVVINPTDPTRLFVLRPGCTPEQTLHRTEQNKLPYYVVLSPTGNGHSRVTSINL